MARHKGIEKTLTGNGENQGITSREWQARPTQSASRGERPIVKPDPATAFVGQSINQQGNMLAFKRREPGRIWRKIKEGGRPVGFSTARFSTGVNPEDPINDSPYWPRP
jgi:hypothetical protein